MIHLRKLTPKQSRFVEEYLIDLNGKQAAIRAGYSKKTAAVIGSQNLTKLNVADALYKAMDIRSKRTEITQDRVLQELARLAYSDMSMFCGWGPGGVTMINSNDIPPSALGCVREVSETSTENSLTTRFKLHDKVAALKMLGQHLGMFTEKVDVSITDKAETLAKILGVKVEDLPE